MLIYSTKKEMRHVKPAIFRKTASDETTSFTLVQRHDTAADVVHTLWTRGQMPFLQQI